MLHHSRYSAFDVLVAAGLAWLLILAVCLPALRMTTLLVSDFPWIR
jgi:hypothetical protein